MSSGAEQLARFGGSPVMSDDQVRAGFGRWPDIRTEDTNAVVAALHRWDEPWGFLHPSVVEFQEAYADFVGRAHCLPVSSGTAALHLSLAATGVAAGDEVVVPALSYVGDATAVLHQNAVPVFADVDPSTFSIDPVAFEKAISPRTRAVIAVDLFGLPADYAAIEEVARRYGIAVVGDSSQSQGARYCGRRAGGLGDVSAVSIMPTKNLPSSGEGGIITTDSEEFAAAVRGFASQGMDPWDTANPAARRVSRQLGFNYRPTPTSMAFAHSQLRRLDFYQEGRAERVAVFEEAAGELPFLDLPHRPAERTHAFQMYRVQARPEGIGMAPELAPHLRDVVVFLLRAEGAVCAFWDHETLPAMPLFQDKTGYGGGCPWTCHHSHVDYEPSDYPVAERAVRTYFMPFIARATHTLDFIRGQAAAYRKVADNLDVVVELTERVAAAGGFEAWSGVSIFDEVTQARMVLRRRLRA